MDIVRGARRIRVVIDAGELARTLAQPVQLGYHLAGVGGQADERSVVLGVCAEEAAFSSVTSLHAYVLYVTYSNTTVVICSDFSSTTLTYRWAARCTCTGASS